MFFSRPCGTCSFCCTFPALASLRPGLLSFAPAALVTAAGGGCAPHSVQSWEAQAPEGGCACFSVVPAGLILFVTRSRHLLRAVPGYFHLRRGAGYRSRRVAASTRFIIGIEGSRGRLGLFSVVPAGLVLLLRVPALASLRAGLLSFAPPALVAAAEGGCVPHSFHRYRTQSRRLRSRFFSRHSRSRGGCVPTN